MSWRNKTLQEKVEDVKTIYDIDVDSSKIKKITLGHESLRNQIAEEKGEDPVDRSQAKHFADLSVTKSVNGHYAKLVL